MKREPTVEDLQEGVRLSNAGAKFSLIQLLCLVNTCSFDCSTLGLMRLEAVIRGWHFFMGMNVFIIPRDFRDAGISTNH